MNIIFILVILVLLFYEEIRNNIEAMLQDLLIAIVSLIALIIKGIKKLKR